MPIRVAVTGGRDYTDRHAIYAALDQLLAEHGGVFFLISGMDRGADTLAPEWAVSRNVPVLAFPVQPADWSRLGKRAGFIRNQRMLDDGRPDVLVSFPGGNGTHDCTERAKRAGIPVWHPYA